MLLLSVDSSAVTASAALTEDSRVIKSEFINKGLRIAKPFFLYSENVMEGCAYKSLDAIAVTAGPGSFTGVRIGICSC